MKRIHALRHRLTENLPGYNAQRRAMPMYRDEGPVDFDALKSPRLSGVLLFLYPESDGSLWFPLMKRQVYEGTHSGQISLPGGRYEEEDGDLLTTALREAEEEIGIPTEDVLVLGKLTRIYIPPSNFIVSPTVGFMNHKPDFRPDPREVRELFYVPVAALFDEMLFRKTNMTVRGIQLNDIPYYKFNDEIVWGATAMILSEFREVLRESGIRY